MIKVSDSNIVLVRSDIPAEENKIRNYLSVLTR